MIAAYRWSHIPGWQAWSSGVANVGVTFLVRGCP